MPMDITAETTNVIHDICLMLIAATYLAGSWLLVKQLMALLR